MMTSYFELSNILGTINESFRLPRFYIFLVTLGHFQAGFVATKFDILEETSGQFAAKLRVISTRNWGQFSSTICKV